jgi:hypothetical protein
MQLILKALTDTRIAAGLIICALLVVYAGLPVFVDAVFAPSRYFVELAQLSVLGCAGIAFGYALPIFDSRFEEGATRIVINAPVFHVAVWAGFVLFLAATFATAPTIPLISAFQGASITELAQERGDFLKTRVGIEAALLYISTIFVGALLPYSLAALFRKRAASRYLLLLLFLGFSISFLQKALFINAILPLLYIAARRKGSAALQFVMIGVLSIGLLYLVTLLAFGGESEPGLEQLGRTSAAEYFSADYVSNGALDHLIWRSVSVPMFTAADTLRVLHEDLRGELLWGATSSFLSAVFSLERVGLERHWKLQFRLHHGGVCQLRLDRRVRLRRLRWTVAALVPPVNRRGVQIPLAGLLLRDLLGRADRHIAEQRLSADLSSRAVRRDFPSGAIKPPGNPEAGSDRRKQLILYVVFLA